MKTRALVVVFTGEPTDEIVRGTIAAVLCKRGATQVDMVELDLKEIAKSIIAAAISDKPEESIENHTPEDEAVILIGTLMKNELAHFNVSTFTAALATKIAEASVNPTSDESKSFMNALFILSKDELLISQSLMKKYKLNHQRINLIKRIYNLSKTF